LAHRHAQVARHFAQGHGEVAGFVQQVDQVTADKAQLRVGSGGTELAFEMLGKRRLVVAALVDAGAVFVSGTPACRRPVAGVTVAVERRGIDVERRIGLARAARDQLVGGRIVGRVLAHLVGSDAALHAHLANLEQRIGFERFADEGFDLEVRQRQQLDRLLQLRRHHQRLRLAKVEARTQRHGSGYQIGRLHSSKPSPR
jgi:hypothetical protein